MSCLLTPVERESRFNKTFYTGSGFFSVNYMSASSPLCHINGYLSLESRTVSSWTRLMCVSYHGPINHNGPWSYIIQVLKRCFYDNITPQNLWPGDRGRAKP